MAISPSEIRNWTIYKIENPDKGVYIGRTSVFKSRMSHYRTLGGKCHKQPLLYQSLLKYGLHGHDVSVLDTFDSNISYAEGKEIFWIRNYMSNKTKYPDKNGLNLAEGGQGSLGMKIIGRTSSFKGKHHSIESKEKLSAYFKKNPPKGMLGKTHTDEVKKAMSDKKKGMVSVFKGKNHTDENRLLFSSSRLGKSNKLKGRKCSEEMKAKMYLTRNTKMRTVILEKDGVEQEFRSIIAAYKFLGIGKGLFTNIINGLWSCRYKDYFIKFKK